MIVNSAQATAAVVDNEHHGHNVNAAPLTAPRSLWRNKLEHIWDRLVRVLLVLLLNWQQ
jgi:hypothetical protein